jgi:hypothetical protein|tara:strand:+ start:8006 stop:8185 length:180 start_codon:yes stop_codon:yes gene_type:complete
LPTITLYENIIKVINGEESITTNALEGLKVVDIIERIYSHADNNHMKNQKKELKIQESL